MNNWNEAVAGATIYVRDEIEVYNDDEQIIGNTKPYQKAYVEYVKKDEVCIVIDGGKFDGYDFYFGTSNNSTPDELLTVEEFKLLKTTEIKVWKDLNKFVKIIDALQEKSDDILTVRKLIEIHDIN